MSGVNEVQAPLFGASELILPEYFVMPFGKMGKYKLVNPTSQERNLSSRKGQKALKLIRKPVKNAVMVEGMSDKIPIELFSKKDQKIIKTHFKLIEKHKNKAPKDVPTLKHIPGKERGRPETLPKNIAVNKERKEAPPKKGRPVKYQSAEEKAIRKREQTLASNKRRRAEKKAQAEATGDGMITDTIRNVKEYGLVKGLKETGKDKLHQAKAILTGNITQLSPAIKALLNKYGDVSITSAVLKRTPVSGLMTGALSLFSGGKFGERQKEKEFDELFHLFMVFTLSNGKKIQLEKEARINIRLEQSAKPHTEIEGIKNMPTGLTLNSILEKTKAFMGDKAFFGYSARDNNCQDFLSSVLRANDMGEPNDLQFIKQDTKYLFKNLTGLRKLSNTLTDIGARADVFMEGGDIHQQYNGEVEALRNKKMNSKLKLNKLSKLQEHYHKLMREAQMKNTIIGNGFDSDDESMEGDGVSDSDDDIDFDDIKWGSFTEQFNRFRNKHKNSPIKDLEQFARMLIENPSKYNKTTIKRARFYLNVLLPKKNKISTNNIKMVKKLTKKQMRDMAMDNTGGEGIYLSGVGGEGMYAGRGMYAGEGFSAGGDGIYAGEGFSASGSGHSDCPVCAMSGGAISLPGGAIALPFQHSLIDEIEGGNIFKSAGRWFRKAGKTINKAVIKPIAKEFSKKGKLQAGVDKAFSKGGIAEKLGRQAFREGVPVLTGALGGLAGSFAGGPAGSLAGSYGGARGGEELVKMSGIGVKKRSSSWIDQVKAVQKRDGISYKDALKVASRERKN